MKTFLSMLFVLVVAGSLALAQCSSCATNESAATDVSVSALCPCAAIATSNLNGNSVIMVLGSEEEYALNRLDLSTLNWREAPSNYASVTSRGNPESNYRPNFAVLRHGNPYYPYYQVSTSYSPTMVAGSMETYSYTSYPSTLSSGDQSLLRTITDQWRGLTPQQAIVLGYQPLCTCISGLGSVYLNQSLLCNTIDATKPQAFVFGPDNRLVAVQYLIMCNSQLTLFGQPLAASDEVTGAQQLTVWLWQSNSNGLFGPRNPAVGCVSTPPTVAGYSQHYNRNACIARF